MLSGVRMSAGPGRPGALLYALLGTLVVGAVCISVKLAVRLASLAPGGEVFRAPPCMFP